MKTIITAALAAATFASPLALNTAAADPPRHGYNRDRNHDRHERRDDRRNYRQGYRDGNWDRRQHNGYYYQNRWYYGPPPAAYNGRYRAGWHDWRRGERLPSYYRSRYEVVDWRYHHLRAPPRGYHYVRDDRGAYLLVGIATGVILGSILSDNY